MHAVSIVLCLLLLSPSGFCASPAARIELRNGGAQPDLHLTQEPIPPVGGLRYRLITESSSDLKNWSPTGELSASDDQGYHLPLTNETSQKFFRLRPELDDPATTADGAELFGFNRIFTEELSKAGFLTPEQFNSLNQPSTDYLPKLGFDPRTAKFFDGFNAAPVPSTHPYDLRMNAAEMQIFTTNGFVVSERLGSTRFADVFYRIFSDDLPVFITADAAMHAWHFSYQRMLEEAEETQLSPALSAMLDAMRSRMTNVSQTVRDGPLKNSVIDADYFIAVARSLLSGQQQSTILGGDADVARTLAAIASLQYFDFPGFPIFGTNRLMDFSQFKIRGHYERSAGLGRYFQAFMWTARIDFRILTLKPDPQTLRELGTAVVLANLLQNSGASNSWNQLDELLRLFVGRTDAMTFAQLQPLLAAAGMTSLESISSIDQLAKFQTDIARGNLGIQLIPGDAYESPFGPEQVQLPRAFAFTGQRFIPDGWALAEVTFDRIKWNVEIPGYTVFGKVLRRYTSALDMAYAVLGNRQVAPEIAKRIMNTASRSNFRDGLPYAHNLSAVTATFDRISSAAWADSIYTRWLWALRALSAPTTDSRFPQAMRTRAWALRTLNTQLASYTELKHDTVLYAKQPYSSVSLCDYPYGFAEPVPEFWKRMSEMADASATALSKLPASGTIVVPIFGVGGIPSSVTVDLAVRQAARVAFCRNFSRQMTAIQALAEKELQQFPFSDAEVSFIRNLMNRQDHQYVGPTYDGWYPGLFYKDYGQLIGTADSNGSNKYDPVVTDIFTAPPDEIDPKGGVLHEATGAVDLLLIAVDNGPDKMMYAGPTMSHYEFILDGPVLKRMADSEWQAQLDADNRPPRPDWTTGYLVPK